MILAWIGLIEAYSHACLYGWKILCYHVFFPLCILLVPDLKLCFVFFFSFNKFDGVSHLTALLHNVFSIILLFLMILY